jgi:hypothetical protein
MLHRGVPFRCLGVGEGILVRRRLDTFSGREEGNGVWCYASWEMMWSSDQHGHVRLFENVLFGLSRPRARHDVTSTGG